MNPVTERVGILLVGHGTRDAVGVAEFFAACEAVGRLLPGLPIEPCFLEICDPPIARGVARLVERGVSEIVVMPLLLFAAGHAKRDVPLAVAAALQRFPNVSSVQAEHLGCHPLLLEQSAERFAEALAGRQPILPEQTALVFVGRGSLDAEAIAETHEFARLAPQASQVGTTHVCFYAMGKPSLVETLDQIAAANVRRVIVQPHLLFGGLILDGLRNAVKAIARKSPNTEWLLTDRLGPTELVARAIVERIDSARKSQVLAATNLAHRGDNLR
jgi:sirohydrochlorin cobaltochelatase